MKTIITTFLALLLIPVAHAGYFGELSSPANKGLFGPTSGGSATATFRAMVGADLPNPSATTLGGTESKSCGASNWLSSISTSGVPACTQPAFSDLSGSITTAQMPTTAVTPGSYTAANITVDAYGRLTAVTSSGAGSGTVTSVGLSLPAEFSLSGTPVTTTGTLTGAWASAAQHSVFAGPSGSAGTPAFRAIVASDLPSTAVTPGSYVQASITVDAQGRVTAAASNGARNWATQAGNYTFVLGDGISTGGDQLEVSTSGSAQTFTVPPHSSVAFVAGEQLDVCQYGAGKLTIAQGAGVTINSKGGNKSLGGQYVCAQLIQTTTADTWILIGDLIP